MRKSNGAGFIALGVFGALIVGGALLAASHYSDAGDIEAEKARIKAEQKQRIEAEREAARREDEKRQQDAELVGALASARYEMDIEAWRKFVIQKGWPLCTLCDGYGVTRDGKGCTGCRKSGLGNK
jgi:hypothetical protein